ncbi:hypothetical protein FACS189438_2010 [Bacteroidia bacterium]|nr:hypothetical protein FACS189438_2010 [Bacteroidia bacterium]
MPKYAPRGKKKSAAILRTELSIGNAENKKLKYHKSPKIITPYILKYLRYREIIGEIITTKIKARINQN